MNGVTCQRAFIGFLKGGVGMECRGANALAYQATNLVGKTDARALDPKGASRNLPAWALADLR